jgi:hypothetical protein
MCVTVELRAGDWSLDGVMHTVLQGRLRIKYRVLEAVMTFSMNAKAWKVGGARQMEGKPELPLRKPRDVCA